MQEPAEKNHSYLVYHFEMGSVDEVYSNIACRNEEASSGSTTYACKCKNTSEDETSQTSRSLCQCAKYTKQGIFYDKVGRGNEHENDKSTGSRSGVVHGSSGSSFELYDTCYNRQASSSTTSKLCPAERPNSGVYVNLADNQEYSRKGPKHQQQRGKRKGEHDIALGPSPRHQQHVKSSQCCSKTRLIVIVQLLTFSMASGSLALVILMIKGVIIPSADTYRDAAGKSEKLADLSSNYQELEAQIWKLKEELDDARKELKELKDKSNLTIDELTRELQQIRNSTQQENTMNVSVQVNQPSKKIDFEMMLNSSQQRVMTMISDIWLFVNKTDRELREDTKSLWSTGNSTQEEIRKVSNSLTKLQDEVNLQEKRLNETSKLKAGHYRDVHYLGVLINSSRHDMMNQLIKMWSSVNSTDKDLQEKTKTSFLAVWTAVNATKMELQRKVNNISKMAGPIGPPGFNGTQGPAGPSGSRGPPGPKGPGDLSTCNYNEFVGTKTSGGTDAQAFVDEPSGSKVIAVTCSTDYPKGYNLASTILLPSLIRRYICNCNGESGVTSTTCKLNYWLCPIT